MTIRNDATRLRIQTKDARRSRAVVARQGQVLLDTDLDQQSRHLLDRVEIETVDSLGSPGRLLVPAGTKSFEISNVTATDASVADGHGYLGGWLLENAVACKLTTQPHPRTDTLSPKAIVGIKALIRHVDPVEDPVLADIALGDAQASGRSVNDWQILALPVAAADPVTCATAGDNAAWMSLIAPSTGTLTLIEQTAPPSSDPCTLTPAGGYSRLENLLFRIEVDGGEANNAFPNVDGARFQLNKLRLKLSRRNASLMVGIVDFIGKEIIVRPPALDARNWFAPGSWAEIVSIHDDVDPRAALATKRMFRVALATDDRVTIEGTEAELTASGAKKDGTWFLRLWDAFPDGKGMAEVAVAGNASESAEIDLGDGLRVKLGKGVPGGPGFRRGDYWTFAARAGGSTDWLKSGQTPLPRVPDGPEVRYAPVAIATPGASPSVADCRIPFGTLSDRLLLYRGGDGQSVFPTPGVNPVVLPAKLRVAVMRGETPVVGATVRFSYVGPAGKSCQIDGAVCNAATTVDRSTGADGLLEVAWAIDPTALLEKHQVAASLVTTEPPSAPAIVFSASFNMAQRVRYNAAAGACSPYSGVSDVAAALDNLVAFACNPPTGDGGLGCCHTVGIIGDRPAEFKEIIEAIKSLREQGHASICLCLLPGEYGLDPDELRGAIEGLTDLVISGREARIVVPERLQFVNIHRVALRDIALMTKSGEALQFTGPSKPDQTLDVELTDLTVEAGEETPGRPLVTFADCRKMRLAGCDLRPSIHPELKDIMPGTFVALVELAQTADAVEVAKVFTAISQSRPATKRSLVTDFEQAITFHRAKLAPAEVKILDRSLDALRSPGPLTEAKMKQLVADFVTTGKILGPGARGWPVAILFAPGEAGVVGSEVDVVIERCRISGGVIVGGPERDVDAELGAELTFDASGLKPGIVPDGSGRMRVEGNVLSWLSIGAEQARALSQSTEDVAGTMKGLLYGEMVVTENTFTSGPHALVAELATVHGNIFEFARSVDLDRWRVGFVASAAVSATGNLGPTMFDRPYAQLSMRGDSGVGGDPPAATEAANSRLRIHVMGT